MARKDKNENTVQVQKVEQKMSSAHSNAIRVTLLMVCIECKFGDTVMITVIEYLRRKGRAVTACENDETTQKRCRIGPTRNKLLTCKEAIIINSYGAVPGRASSISAALPPLLVAARFSLTPAWLA